MKVNADSDIPYDIELNKYLDNLFPPDYREPEVDDDEDEETEE